MSHDVDCCAQCMNRSSPTSSWPGRRLGVVLLASLAWLVWLTAATSLAREADTARSEAAEAAARLLDAARYLASDELEGRGIGTAGLERAADFLAEQFSQMGLQTKLVDGAPFQTFPVTISAQMGPKEKNTLTFVGPPDQPGSQPRKFELQLDRDFSPLAVGGSGKFDLPLVFAGYGISAEKEGYDDYAGIDVKGKAVVLLRHQPQRGNPHALFGTQDSAHAFLSRKISNAYQHGAAAVIFATGDYEIQQRVAEQQKRWSAAINELAKAHEAFHKIKEPTLEQLDKHRQDVERIVERIKLLGDRLQAEYDPVLSFSRAGDAGEGRRFPVLHCRRGAIDQVIEAALGTDLATLERQIDNGPTPHSRELEGWRAVGQTDVKREAVEIKNVIAVLEGEGPHAEETIIVGAHYDHLGFGGAGSLKPGSKEIHYGADDNASGTATLLEVARQLAAREQKLPRRVVFIAFTGEERGLLGSAHYVREPLIPLDKTVAMLNMDMVGRLRDDKLIIYGHDTAKEFDALIDRLSEQFGFKITRQAGGFGPSDHASFYARDIPVLHFFTGTHSDYHRPSDTVDKLNIEGMQRIGQMVAEMVVELAQGEAPPTFQQSKRTRIARGGDRPYFGSIPDFGQEQPGFAIMGVAKGGPADKAGLKAGDVIVKLGDNQIGNLEDFDGALRKFKAGDKVPVVVRRGVQELTLEVTLEPPR